MIKVIISGIENQFRAYLWAIDNLTIDEYGYYRSENTFDNVDWVWKFDDPQTATHFALMFKS